MTRHATRKTIDLTLKRIEAFNDAQGGGVVVRKDPHGYSLFREDTGMPVARLRPSKSGNLIEVLWWKRSGERWDSIGDFGGMWFTLDDALEYIAEDPMGCFWY
jgi:hypothetical protein